MSPKHIFHVCTEESWTAQNDSSYYTHESLSIEDFIHCSLEHQIDGVLHRYFKNIEDLLLLTIDVSKLSAKLQFDVAPNGDEFPHVYGTINKKAILNIEKINSPRSI